MHSTDPSLRSRAAFTLVELLSVIAIVGILAAIIITGIARAREAARATHCSGNLRTLHTAALLAITDQKNRLLDRTRWPSAISPYLTLKGGYEGDGNWPEGVPSPFRCEADHSLRPSDRAYTRTYAINHFVCPTTDDGATALSNTAKTLADIANPSQVAFFMDGPVNATSGKVYWTYLRPSNLTGGSPPLYSHGGAINVIFTDGHVRRITRAEMLAEHHTEARPLWGKVY